MSTEHQIAANRANARQSTGPRTVDGKARSARNNFRHGLASARLIVPGEDPAGFDELVEGLRADYNPATQTEDQLILRMAQHFWLAQRAVRLQNEAFLAGYTPDKLALLLRYQTSNDRGYHQCLATLLKLKAAGLNRNIGFESQNRAVAGASQSGERQNAHIVPLNANTGAAQLEAQISTPTGGSVGACNYPADAKDPGPTLKAA
ncbi:MAG TPA: hypothetical protein VN737_18225 [Bryobacteraceae bacterium]|jgi:hypothetical protein|nr:hypothetical protein [Bryobacteraceae bacterium]